jgi:DNA-binding transcriptional LysR family regulator
MDWLTATKSFHLLVEHGSFTAAADVAEISPSAMSKRIDWLEKQLGISLFVRTTRQVNLTEVGSEFLPKAKSFLKQFESMVSETKQNSGQPTGLLKIAATLITGSSLLMPHIKDFLASYPEVKIQLDVLPFGDVPDLEHDLVICRKFENFNSSAHKGTHLISYDIGLYGSPEYLANHAKIKKVGDVAQHKVLLTNYFRKMGKLEMGNGEYCPLTNFNFVTDNVEALLYATVNGMGLLFASPLYLKTELKKGLLVPILPELETSEMQLWGFYPKSDFMPVKTRLFLDFLKDRL